MFFHINPTPATTKDTMKLIGLATLAVVGIYIAFIASVYLNFMATQFALNLFHVHSDFFGTPFIDGISSTQSGSGGVFGGNK